jgi:predicted nucleotidyltransferase
LIQRLADAGFEYVVVGGYASVLHGSAYVTDDLDVCAELSAKNIGKLRTALADLNPRHRMTHGKISFLNQPPAGQAVHNLYLETEGGILDILNNVLGVGDYHRLRQHAVEVPLFGRKCLVISLEDLIAAKEALGREKDLLTVKELRAIAAKRKSGRSI